MTRDRPTIGNPFPTEAVATTTIRGVPDYRETAAFRESWSVVENFVEDFVALQARAHVTLGLRGAFGSGKTHLLLQLLDSFTGGAPQFQLSAPDVSGGRALAFYVKIDQMQLMDVYVNQVMRHLELDDFRTIIASQLAKSLRSRRGDLQVQPHDGPSLVEIASDAVDGQLDTNPQLILALLESDLLPVTGLAQAVNADVRNSAADIGESFLRAYAYLTDQTLGPVALRWLKGQTLVSGEMKDLGLSIPAISSSNHARTALRLLLTVLAQANVRLMLCLDELERGALAGGESERIAAAAFVKDVAEVFIDAKQCVVFCGVDDAWNAMTPDVFDRIRNVVTVRMSSEEVLGVLGVYCAASSLNRDVLFGRDARTLLIEIASRSPRRLLTVAHHTYNNMQRRGGTVATVEDVRDAAERALETNRRRGTVLQVVNVEARRRGWDVIPDAPFGDSRVDLLLTKSDRQIAVHVLNSLFKLDELSDARAVVQHTRSTADRGRIAHSVIVTGYSTADVRQELNRFVDRVFWYEEGQFAEAFGSFLDQGPAVDSAVRTQANAQQAAYQTLEHRFAGLETTRQAEVDRLNQLLTSLQTEMRRSRELARDARAGDKIELTFDALGDLLDRELALARTADEQSVYAILNEQRGLVRRLLLLNEPLPEREVFDRAVKRLDAAIADASADNIGERREMVVHLESLHLARRHAMSMSTPRRWMRAVRREWALSAAVTATVLGAVFFLYDASLIRGEVAELNTHVSVLQRTSESLTFAFEPIDFRDDPSFASRWYRLTMTQDELTRLRNAANTSIAVLGDVLDRHPLTERLSPNVAGSLEEVREAASELVATVRSGLQKGTLEPEENRYSEDVTQLASKLIAKCRSARAELATVGALALAIRFHVVDAPVLMLVVGGWALAILVMFQRRWASAATLPVEHPATIGGVASKVTPGDSSTRGDTNARQ